MGYPSSNVRDSVCRQWCTKRLGNGRETPCKSRRSPVVYETSWKRTGNTPPKSPNGYGMSTVVYETCWKRMANPSRKNARTPDVDNGVRNLLETDGYHTVKIYVCLPGECKQYYSCLAHLSLMGSILVLPLSSLGCPRCQRILRAARAYCSSPEDVYQPFRRAESLLEASTLTL